VTGGVDSDGVFINVTVGERLATVVTLRSPESARTVIVSDVGGHQNLPSGGREPLPAGAHEIAERSLAAIDA